MRRNYERGVGHWIVALIGLVLILYLIGFFRTDQPISKITYKTIQRLPCGLTVQHPKDERRIRFPVKVDGYVNKCGWEAQSGSAGTVQVFDASGKPVTAELPLVVLPDATGYPYYFSASLKLIDPPRTDTGTVIIRGVTGLSHAIVVDF